MVHQPVSRGFVVFADAWLSGWLAEISANLRENGSALEVVLHDYALYKSTFTLLYFTSELPNFATNWHRWSMSQLCGSGGQRSRSQEAKIGRTLEHDISEMDEVILLQIGTSGPPGQGHRAVNFGGEEEAVVRFGVLLEASVSTTFGSTVFLANLDS